MGKHLPPLITLSARALVPALSLSLALPATATAWAREQPQPLEEDEEQPVREAPRVRVAIDTHGLSDDDAARIRELLGDEIARAVADQGYLVTDGQAEVTLRVRVEYLDEEDLEYGIHYDIVLDGSVDDSTPWVACVTCVDAALVRKVHEGMPKALETLAGVFADEPVPSEEPAPSEEPVPAPGEEIKAIGPLGIVGIALGVSGLGLVVGGAVEVARGIEVEPTLGQNNPVADHRTPGAVLLGVGGALLISGVTLIAVDLSKRKRKRQDAIAVFPTFGAGFVGLGAVQRF